MATKGFESMTMADVAAGSGISTETLHQIYLSKEALANAAMLYVVDTALSQVEQLRCDDSLTPFAKLHAILRWAVNTKLKVGIPAMPARDSDLAISLVGNATYMKQLFQLSMNLGIWISQAQKMGALKAELPVDFVIYSLYSCATDPALSYLRRDGNYSDAQVIAWALERHFQGISTDIAVA
jgi:TetR/AcrR family transcriptional regulator, regulator of autoinduction and epiphytic fitness